MSHGNPHFTVIFVIQGKEFPIEVNPNQAIISAVAKVLAQSGNPGSTNEWKVRTEDGRILDTSKSFKDEHITGPTKLFLNKGTGRGG
jgi:hypothetical protein